MASPILPLSMGRPNGHSSLGSSRLGLPGRAGRACPLLFKRLSKMSSMDFELAVWQLTYLCVAPRRVYRAAYHHKQTKNVWARDDPALLILTAVAVTIAGFLWATIWAGYRSPLPILYVVFLMVIRDFFIVCLLMSLIIWAVANLLLVAPSQQSSHATDSKVELAYAFDVAVNSFFPSFVTLGVAQLVLAPVLIQDNWISLWAGNTLYLVAAIQYTLNIFLGISSLPFTIRSELLLTPLLPLIIGYFLSLMGFNIAAHALTLYFGINVLK